MSWFKIQCLLVNMHDSLRDGLMGRRFAQQHGFPNGRRLLEATRISDGDILSIGQTTFDVDANETTQTRPGNGPKKSVMYWMTWRRITIPRLSLVFVPLFCYKSAALPLNVTVYS